ncbi:MAG: energy transducer TonB [Vicinamibacteria bacterium]
MRTLSLDLRDRAANNAFPDDANARGTGASLLIHGAGITALLLAPLFSAVDPPDATRAASAVLVRPVVVELPPAPNPAPAGRRPGSSKPSQAPVLVVLATPSHLPANNPGDILDVPTDTSVGTGTPLGDPGRDGPPGGGDCQLGALCGTAGPRVDAPKDPVHIGGLIKEPRLLENRPVIYPEIARAAGVSAVVILEAHIDSNGHVEDVKILRGHPLFDEAALASARSRRYEPLLLNGVRTDFILTITMTFNLHR